MSKRTCINPSCSMRDREVETDRATCLSCGRAMTDPLSGLGGLFDSLFGRNDLGDMSRPVPAEVLDALRDAENVLSWFVNGAPVKRKDLVATHEAIVVVLRRWG
jgi:hypothetical protein